MREALGSSELSLEMVERLEFLDLVKLARDRISMTDFSPQMVVEVVREIPENFREILVKY